MARRSSKPEDEKDAGNPVEPTESMPEPDTSEQFGEKRIEAMPESEKGAMDHVNAPVQDVQRDAYMDNEKDLHFLAEKVDHFNETKKMVRDPSIEPMPDDLKESADEDDWEEPEDRLDEADSDDEDEDDEED